MTLGRLVAAERNARAGLDLSRRHEAEQADIVARIARLEQQIVQQNATINALFAQLSVGRGTGPTSG